MFSKPGLPIKMTVDNNTFESFKVLHIYYFILSSQLYETDSIDYYYYYHNIWRKQRHEKVIKLTLSDIINK